MDTLRIWDAEAINDFQLDSFDKAITTKRWSRRTWPGPSWRFFTPNDAHMAGKELRLKQQYFFISASVQTAIKKYKKHHQ